MAFPSEGCGFGPAGRHAISPAWGTKRCSVPGVAWLAEFVGSAVPQVTERGIGEVGHASSLNDQSDDMPVSVGSFDLKTVGFCSRPYVVHESIGRIKEKTSRAEIRLSSGLFSLARLAIYASLLLLLLLSLLLIGLARLSK